MGILNRTPDSFFDQGRYYDFDGFLAKAEQLVAEGADFLDVGGVKAGPGPEVTEEEELERVIPAIEALEAALRRAALGRHVAGVGARARRSPPGRSSATTSAASPTPTTCRWPRRRARPSSPPTSGSARASPTPSPSTTTGGRRRVPLPARRGPRRPRPPASRASGSWSTPGLDLGKTEPQSLELLRAHDRLAALGCPLFLSASNKRFLGDLLGTESTTAARRRHAAHALGIALGCRILRAHDVAGRPADRRRDGRRPAPAEASA